eukprot:GFUD01016613.1.p1 GENE.GFUD01016613.1~~GFUD01016613.1.p1  ORF type:complete len:333 (-),score=85.70 GFUD01016613.1:181-1179(-)
MLEEIYFNLTQHKYERASSSSGEESSSFVWLVLFSVVMSLSVVVNTIFITALMFSRKMSMTHIFLLLFFIINLVDYSLLIFEFSLGAGSQYPYNDESCSFYQLLLQGNPLLSSGVLLLFVYNAYSATFLSQPRLLLLLSLLLLIQLLLSIPTLVYSGLAVYPSGARYCVMDLGGVAAWAGLPMERQQMATSLYYLMYKPVLTYWLPICLLTAPLVKMGKLVNTTKDDQFNITLTITIIISYGVFHLPHASTAFVRHFLAICSSTLSYRDRWLLDVIQSLFLLISYFSHLFRPLVCLVLDPDILASLYRSSYKVIDYKEVKCGRMKKQSEIVP